MKPRHFAIGLMLLSFTLLACTLASSAAPSEKPAPPLPGPSTEATLPPLAPGTLIPTRIPPTPTQAVTTTPIATPTVTATLTPTATPRPVSSGPLDFTISLIGCRPDATREGGVILTLRFDATGGNGVYTYYRENQRTTRTYERPATKGTAAIDSYRVESGDGQSIEKKERFPGSQFGCP
jgi:type 1 fimbria pilin